MIVRRGRPLTPIMRRMLKYSSVWIFGAFVLLSICKTVRWLPDGWIMSIVAWGALVGAYALWRHKRKERAETVQKRSAQGSGGDIKQGSAGLRF
jgi:hypothetical protein